MHKKLTWSSPEVRAVVEREAQKNSTLQVIHEELAAIGFHVSCSAVGEHFTRRRKRTARAARAGCAARAARAARAAALPPPMPRAHEGLLPELTPDEARVFRAMVETGSGPLDVAEHLRRPVETVLAVASALGVPTYWAARSVAGRGWLRRALHEALAAGERDVTVLAGLCGLTEGSVIARAKGEFGIRLRPSHGPERTPTVERTGRTPAFVPESLRAEWRENAALVGRAQASALIRGLMAGMRPEDYET